MELTGQLVNASLDIASKKMMISFLVNEADVVRERFDIEKDMELSITTKKKSKKRSLSANAYFHLLAGKLADKWGTSKPWMKNRLLFLYGQREDFVLEGSVVNEKEFLEREDIHMWAIGEYGTRVKFAVMTPSRFLSSDKFRILLDGTIDECRESGIETITPSELAHMLSVWKGAGNDIDT